MQQAQSSSKIAVELSEKDCSTELDTTLSDKNGFNQSAPWFHGTFHLLCSNIGIGVLALPCMLQILGWAGGLVWFAVISTMFAFSMYCIGQCSNSRKDGTRLQTYVKLLHDTFGSTTASVFGIAICCLQLGTMVAFLLTISTNAEAIFNQFKAPDTKTPKHLIFTTFAVLPQVILCFVPNLENFAWISLVGACATVGYVVITLYLCVTIHVDTSDAVISPEKGFNKFVTSVNGASFVIFAYGVMSLTPNVLFTLREEPSKDPVDAPGRHTSMRAIWPFIVVNILVLLVFMVVGKWSLGPLLIADADVLVTIARCASTTVEKTLITTAQVFIIMHVITSYQIFAFSLFDILGNAYTEIKGYHIGYWTDKGCRILIVLISWFIAIALPFFGDILGVVAAFFSLPVSYAIPPFMLYVRRKEFMIAPVKAFFWAFEVFCVVLVILCAISAIMMLVNDVAKFNAFSR